MLGLSRTSQRKKGKVRTKIDKYIDDYEQVLSDGRCTASNKVWQRINIEMTVQEKEGYSKINAESKVVKETLQWKTFAST